MRAWPAPIELSRPRPSTSESCVEADACEPAGGAPLAPLEGGAVVVGDYAATHDIELVCMPYNASWLNRIEAQFTGLRYFALDGTDHRTHKERGRAIRRYISWRNRRASRPPPTQDRRPGEHCVTRH